MSSGSSCLHGMAIAVSKAAQACNTLGCCRPSCCNLNAYMQVSGDAAPLASTHTLPDGQTITLEAGEARQMGEAVLDASLAGTASTPMTDAIWSACICHLDAPTRKVQLIGRAWLITVPHAVLKELGQALAHVGSSTANGRVKRCVQE